MLVPLVPEEDELGFPHWGLVAATPRDILDRARALTEVTRAAERRARAAAEARDTERQAMGLLPLQEWRHKEWKGQVGTVRADENPPARGKATTFDSTRSGETDNAFNPLGLDEEDDFDAFENCSEPG